MDYKEALEYIDSVSWLGSKPGLDRVAELLDRLGRPQDDLKFIHIAGTNGKGSCAAMLASVLKSAGYRTGLFTSPYLYRFNERMQINSEQIENDSLAAIVSQVKPAAEAMAEHPTEFEMMTAAALLWYKQEKCDIVVLEAGLGGRFDATNIIEAPELSIIMNIGLDHTGVLGDSVEKIAFEKAGIIKKDRPCVLYEQSESVTNVIRARCQELGSELHISDNSRLQSLFDSLYGQSFVYKDNEYALPLLGRHQLSNAAVVLEAVDVLRALGWKLPQNEVEHGIYAVSWPGRFELVSEEPCFIVDGGHNPQCAQTVVENLENYFPDTRRVLLIGVLADKDYPELLRILAPVADSFVCTQPVSDRALSAEKLAEELRQYGKEISVCPEIAEAVSQAVSMAGDDGMVCAVGSLYSVGEIRACFGLY